MNGFNRPNGGQGSESHEKLQTLNHPSCEKEIWTLNHPIPWTPVLKRY